MELTLIPDEQDRFTIHAYHCFTGHDQTHHVNWLFSVHIDALTYFGAPQEHELIWRKLYGGETVQATLTLEG